MMIPHHWSCGELFKEGGCQMLMSRTTREVVPGDGQRGHYVGMCMAIFAPLGIVLWLLLDNPGMIAVGTVIGIAVGVSLDRKKTDQLPTQGGNGSNSVAVLVVAGTLLMGLLVVLALL
jgi:hypothetical protein